MRGEGEGREGGGKGREGAGRNAAPVVCEQTSTPSDEGAAL